MAASVRPNPLAYHPHPMCKLHPLMQLDGRSMHHSLRAQHANFDFPRLGPQTLGRSNNADQTVGHSLPVDRPYQENRPSNSPWSPPVSRGYEQLARNRTKSPGCRSIGYTANHLASSETTAKVLEVSARQVGPGFDYLLGNPKRLCQLIVLISDIASFLLMSYCPSARGVTGDNEHTSNARTSGFQIDDRSGGKETRKNRSSMHAPSIPHVVRRVIDI